MDNVNVSVSNERDRQTEQGSWVVGEEGQLKLIPSPPPPNSYEWDQEQLSYHKCTAKINNWDYWEDIHVFGTIYTCIYMY